MGSLVSAARTYGEAPPGTIRLDYVRRDNGCADEQTFRDLVAAQLGGVDPFHVASGAARGDTAAKRVVVTLRRSAGASHGTIALHDGGRLVGTREMESASCGPLVHDLALSLGLMVRPILPANTPRATKVASKAETPPRADKTAKASASRAPRPRVRFGVGPTLAAGSSPAPVIGIAGFVGVRWPLVSLALEGRGDLPATTDAASRGSSIDASLVTGSFVPCLHARWLFGCGVVTAGVARGNGADLRAAAATAAYAATGARLGAELAFNEHLAAQLAGDVLVNVARPRIAVDDRAIWQAAPIAGLFGLRLIASF